MPSWPSRSSVIPGAVGISPETFKEIDQLISSLRVGSREWQAAMDLGTHALAKTSQGIVQRYYRGQVTSPADARRNLSTWGIPVRRVSQKTYKGWQVRRISSGVWELYSNERGAFMVEYGIHRGGSGRRRPVLRKSAVDTLSFIRRSRFGQRIMAETFGNLRNNKGHFNLYTRPLYTESPK